MCWAGLDSTRTGQNTDGITVHVCVCVCGEGYLDPTRRARGSQMGQDGTVLSPAGDNRDTE